MNAPAAIAVEKSRNGKIGKLSATYVSQAACPDTCPLKDGGGCYAEYGHVGMVTKRLNKATETDPVAIAVQEAVAILNLTGKYDLRLHVVGDCSVPEAAAIVGAAARTYIARHNRRVYTYTHAWRNVPRAAWGEGVSVLASCETLADVKEAQAAGYGTAMIVAHHPEDGKAVVVDGQRLIPCPQQMREALGKPGITCAECGLCMGDNRLRDRNATITFAAHGVKKSAVLSWIGPQESPASAAIVATQVRATSLDILRII